MKEELQVAKEETERKLAEANERLSAKADVMAEAHRVEVSRILQEGEEERRGWQRQVEEGRVRHESNLDRLREMMNAEELLFHQQLEAANAAANHKVRHDTRCA